MRFVLILSLCLLSSFGAFAQSEPSDNKSAIAVEEITLTRDDENGKPGAAADKFATTDVPIRCFVQLDSSKPVTVKMNLVAVRAAGLKPETKIIAVSYTTKENDDQVNFNASPKGVWAAGIYRADVYIDGKLAKSRNFEIEKSAKEAKQEKLTTPKTFVPRKSVNKTRRN